MENNLKMIPEYFSRNDLQEILKKYSPYASAVNSGTLNEFYYTVNTLSRDLIDNGLGFDVKAAKEYLQEMSELEKDSEQLLKTAFSLRKKGRFYLSEECLIEIEQCHYVASKEVSHFENMLPTKGGNPKNLARLRRFVSEMAMFYESFTGAPPVFDDTKIQPFRTFLDEILNRIDPHLKIKITPSNKKTVCGHVSKARRERPRA